MPTSQHARGDRSHGSIVSQAKAQHAALFGPMLVAIAARVALSLTKPSSDIGTVADSVTVEGLLSKGESAFYCRGVIASGRAVVRARATSSSSMRAVASGRVTVPDRAKRRGITLTRGSESESRLVRM
jgi:hypothetical protein